MKKEEGSKAAGKSKGKAKTKKKSRGRPVRVWRIVNDGYIHKIEFYVSFLIHKLALAMIGRVIEYMRRELILSDC